MLWTLLDGHNEIFCSPIHDKSFEGFMNEDKNAGWIKNNDLKTIRKLLNKTNYYNLELLHWNGFYTFDFSSDDRLKIPNKFDFYEFDEMFISSLKKAENWSIKYIVTKLYESMFKTYNDKKNDYPKYFCSMGAPIDWKNNNFDLLLPQAKCVQVRREVEGIMASISNRAPKDDDYRSKYGYSKSFNKRIKDCEIEKILNFYHGYDLLQQELPERFLTVKFRDLIEDTEETMKNISEFLNIDFDPILIKGTRDGEELVCNGKKYVGEVYDSPANLLSEKEKKIIRRRKYLFKFHKNKYFPLSKKFLKNRLRGVAKILLD